MGSRAVWFVFVAVFSQTAWAAEIPKVTVAPVARTHLTVTGQDIVVPDRPDIVVATVTFPPGSRLP